MSSVSVNPVNHDAAFAEAYGTLRALAKAYLRNFRNTPTLQATALVHEAYLKLARDPKRFGDHHHFVRTAAMAMRQVLVDHARARKSQKRGGGVEHITLDSGCVPQPGGVDVLLINDALQRLQQLDARQAQIVELRCFMGLDVREVAENMELSEATVKREWAMARAWLEREFRSPGTQ